MGLHQVTRRSLLIGGLAGGALLAAGTPAWAQAASPAFIDCAGWGARRNSRPVLVHNRRPIRILVHHTATPNVTDYSRGAADRLARGIQNFHMDRRGWLDTGQHFTISRGGFVLEGRHRSLEILRAGRQQVESAHCTGQNLVSIGIENEGIYSNVAPPEVLWARLRDLCAFVCLQYGIAPTEIYGHRDYKDTLCPGDVLYGQLPRLRGEVGGVLGRRVENTEERAVWPVLRLDDQGPVVLVAQHLLRSAGRLDVVADGRFRESTAEAVRRFQAEQRTEEVNGIIGGESWPLLVGPAGPGVSAEADLARSVLSDAVGRSFTADGPDEWRAMLSAAR